jgi:hypothetical protein
MKMRPLFAIVFAVACFWPTDLCSCPPALYFGVVEGVVTKDNALVAGADVTVGLGWRTCVFSFPSMLVDGSDTKTDPAGRYHYQLRALAGSDTSCLRIVARSGPDSAVTSGVRIRLGEGKPELGQTVRIDLALP